LWKKIIEGKTKQKGGKGKFAVATFFNRSKKNCEKMSRSLTCENNSIDGLKGAKIGG